MKNFFKKLAFVLALAMVVTSVAPALTASAATNNYVKITGDSTAYKNKQSVNVFVKDEKYQLTPYVNGKKAAGTWTTTDTKYIKLSKTGILKPVKGQGSKQGTAVVTFTSTDKKNKITLNIKVGNRARVIKLYATDANGVKTGDALKTLNLTVGDTTTIWTAMAAESKATNTSTDNSYVKVYEDEACTKEVTDSAILGTSYTNRRKTALSAKTPGTVYIKAFAAQSKAGAADSKVASQVVKVVVADKFSAKQTGAKTITVATGDTEVDSTTKFTLKKGSTPITPDKFATPDKHTLVITTPTKISDGDYTIEMGELKATFKGETETLAKFELASEHAAVDAATIPASKKATVAYTADNQFGEAMNVSVQGSCSFGSLIANKGVAEITFADPHNFREGDVGTVTLFNTEYAKNITGQVKISAKSTIKEISVDEVYNKDKKTLTADINVDTNKFYLILSAKDQYGNKVTAEGSFESDLVVSVSNTYIAGVNNNGNVQKAKVEKLDDGRIGLLITPSSETTTKAEKKVKAGTTNIMFMTTSFGTTYNYELTVAEGSRVDKITLFQPENGAYAGENVEIPFEAIDMYGKACTDIDALNALVKAGRVTVSNVAPKELKYNNVDVNAVFEKNYATGKIVLKTAKIASPNPVSVVISTETGNTSSLLINGVKDASRPTALGGIKSDVATATVALTGSSISLTAKNFIVYDQYERQMPDAKVEAAVSGGGYEIVVLPSSENVIAKGLFTTTMTAITGSAQTFLAQVRPVSDEAISTAKVTFQLRNATNEVMISNSEKEVTFKNLGMSSAFSSYEFVDMPDKIYAGYAKDASEKAIGLKAEHQPIVKVRGIMPDGTKVSLPGDNVSGASVFYTVNPVGEIGYSTGSAITIGGVAVTAGALYAKSHTSYWNASTHAGTQNATLYVTMPDGKTISKSIVLSEEVPALDKFAFNTEDSTISANGDVITIYDGVDNLVARNSTAKYRKILVSKDQYGVTIDKDLVVVISDLKKATGSKAQIVNNASDKAYVAGLAAGDSYTMSITSEGKTITANVIVK